MLGEIEGVDLVQEVRKKGIMTIPVPEGVDIRKAVAMVRRFGLGCCDMGKFLVIVS